jgi:hypothetical protein
MPAEGFLPPSLCARAKSFDFLCALCGVPESSRTTPRRSKQNCANAITRQNLPGGNQNSKARTNGLKNPYGATTSRLQDGRPDAHSPILFQQNPFPTTNPDGCAANSSKLFALYGWRARIQRRAGGCPTGTLPTRGARGRPSCDNRDDPSHTRGPERPRLAAQARPSLTQAPPKRQSKIAKRRNDAYDAYRSPPTLEFRSCHAVTSTMHASPPRRCAIQHTVAHTASAPAARASAKNVRRAHLNESVCHPGFTHSPLRRTKISVARPELTTRFPFSSVSTTYEVQIIATSPNR